MKTFKALKTLFSLTLLSATFLLGGCKKTDEVQVNQYILDSTSLAEWKGYKKDGQHTGSFSVTGQNLVAVRGQLKSGDFVIPIASIKNFDLPAQVKPALLDHLKSPDFFNLALHPEAKFCITKVTPYAGGDALAVEDANCLITGDFTLLNKTNSVSFPARVTFSNGKMSAEAILQIDRTKWGMNSYSDPAAELYILPQVDMHLKLSASKR